MSGVRSSWLMFARNTLLARLAASARSRSLSDCSFASVARVRARCIASLMIEIIVQLMTKTTMPIQSARFWMKGWPVGDQKVMTVAERAVASKPVVMPPRSAPTMMVG